MAVKIMSVEKHSPCARKGVKDGWTLLSVNGNEINDVLDYQFYIKDEKLELSLKNEKGKEKHIKIKKSEQDDIGLEFETYLMDKQNRCANGCIFCFIDQMPPDMRETLYFKDDDSRLSFLFGNYITLTNLSQRDVDRIIKMHISPVNVSVHTMNPDLRVQMMKNKNSGKSLEILKTFAENDIKLNAQLVLCPGINDGKELKFSLNELAKLYPSLQSIACVPVGITKFREHLPLLEEYNKETAAEVIRMVDEFGEKFMEHYGTRLAFCSDEFYILAERNMPGEEYYEDYPQIENGVGLCKSLELEFAAALADCDEKPNSKELSVATGVAAYPLIKSLADSVSKKYPDIKINVFEIVNRFFGESITVAGLITGKDLTAQLKGKALGEKLIIPSVMLRSEGDRFLDDVTLEELENELNINVEVSTNDGYELLDCILN